MKISIIIPYKNSEQWLPRCINSLIEQSGDFEFIFVNDGSIDNSKQIIENVSDSRIKSFDNNRTAGVGGARNTGLDNVSGEWFTFLDSDDESINGVYGIYLNAINQSKENVIQFNFLKYSPKRNRAVQPKKSFNHVGLYSTKNMPHYWEFVTNKLYNHETFKNLRFEEGMKWGEDELFNLNCLAIDNRIKCSESNCFIWHFYRPNSLMKTVTKDDLLKQVKKLEEFISNQQDKKIREFAQYWLDFHYTTNKYKELGVIKDN